MLGFRVGPGMLLTHSRYFDPWEVILTHARLFCSPWDVLMITHARLLYRPWDVSGSTHARHFNPWDTTREYSSIISLSILTSILKSD